MTLSRQEVLRFLGEHTVSPPRSPPRAPEGWALVANLPCNIATSLVADLPDEVPAIERKLVMVQQEVASSRAGAKL
jgi:16S rRNA A1518/A1519 N6-dimethyltransferase RsmA/KsgA/DIM1 with predicted DNA glycosylase/AP lyase activity